ncbi:conserved Plasmodium protein, unknown function [Plasmodium knowlesi strain H]|uniref:Uncharacterized protein n=3 Tax=Plasmodium knowlesi TaxID=5850 RepID=A0A5K1UIB4_PLAKH|nr:conserved Plasmodium protein, unknown function [Plasmodium knowlesi strain H]OTN65991.1 Uncharacterized protein PKNOH_S100045800 [Plasmodium knowlesi]CAA9987821.1 conserved Plasmodium protein, unknown function [Plasmodium knowlesi strain H]SBO22377.1 conserved Plasmodium protein, unknown function [Plasmodium knowlesi strain H]SBO29509.1 conserved Plasmodium protein, unknown function [Plasmodium knowlesi strain H]VVS77295.1 conserved Plasmodium protein, unknown function [Plasmodium knowlesi |eukprot:XP_002258818.1 hypothetical protein, conserved in Plasmodium species [Plasmodium knowlesi strain H]
MYAKSVNAQNGVSGPKDENYRNDENCENNKMNMNNYKNIMHNQKKKKLDLMDMDYLDKAVNFRKADKKGNNCVAGDDQAGSENDEEEEEDEDTDEDDEDYQIGDDEEDDSEDDELDDDYEEEEFDDEVRQINFNSYNNYYYETTNAEEGENNLHIDHQGANQNEDAQTDRKNQLMFERYNKLLANYRSNKEQMREEHSNGKVMSKGEEDEAEEGASSCYSCNSNNDTTAREGTKGNACGPRETVINGNANGANPNSEYYLTGDTTYLREESDNFISDVLNRIDQIYNKQSRYTNLKNVNNSNNSICINDLNLNLISDYLNVDISVFHKKTTVLLLGNPQSGKSSFINWFTESYVQNTNSIGKKNEITYVDIKNKFKFNFKRLNNANYQFGLVNRYRNRGGYYGSSHYGRERDIRQMNNDHMGDSNEDDLLPPPGSPVHNVGKDNQSKKIILSGENCDYLFMPFQKLRKKAHNVKKYIFGKICYQNNLTKYMNRINSVSFLDTSGINDICDLEYDEIIMNLSKYVDAIFIFIDSNQFSINNRLLRIINYLMDNQLNKVTICLTRIDMIQRVNLYRVVFYLTQYFLRSLNLFRYGFANPNGASSHVDESQIEPYVGHHTEWNEHAELQWRSKSDWRNPLSKKAHMINEFFNRSIRSFQNVLLFPKMITKMISRRTTQRGYFHIGMDNVEQRYGEEQKTYNQGGHNYGEGDHYFGEEEAQQDDHQLSSTDYQSDFPRRHREGERMQEKTTGEEETGGIFKKILTKSYNSFKDKILNSGNVSKGGISRLNSTLKGEKNSMEQFTRKRTDPPKSNERKLKTHLHKLFEKKINYGDCLKNMSIFFVVLMYEVVTTIYSIIHTSISNYIKRTSGGRGRATNVEKLHQLDEANKLKYTHMNDRGKNTYKVLEFLTIYLPEIPNDLLKREKWKYEKGKVEVANRKYNNERRNRFSCNIQYEHDDYGGRLKNDLCSDEPDDHMGNRHGNTGYSQRRSIPEEFLLLGNGSAGVRRYGDYVKGNYTRGSYIPGVDNNVSRESFLTDSDYHVNGRSSGYLPPGTRNGMYNRMRNEDVRELNMIHELIFKIDETIDLKSNQSIYMLKRDLEKIQSTCLKRLSDNEHVVKQNRSLRIQNIKFYFFKYMAIFFGFIISLLRYDLLVYFNFIKPELLFSIFSKYFLFLSSYNKNSLFIAVNILLVVAYLGLYVRYNRRNYFKSLGKSDLNKLKIIMLFTQILFDEINQLHLRLIGGRERDDPAQPSAPSESNGPSDREDVDYAESDCYDGFGNYHPSGYSHR